MNLVVTYPLLFFILTELKLVGLGPQSNQAVFGQQENSTKSKLVQLISAVQTLLRSMSIFYFLLYDSSLVENMKFAAISQLFTNW